jgi:hypothetical protein
MPANPGAGNPRGYYENVALRVLHDKFLSDIDSIWWDHKPVRPRRFLGLTARRFRQDLRQLLVEQFGPDRPLIKDPRLCRLMPLWLPIIKDYFPQASFLLPIRHPVEVALSLGKRDQLELDKCLKLWAVHVLEGERATRGFSRQFTTYDQLMKSPVETVAPLAKNLGLAADAVTIVVPGQIDPSLRHHAAPSWPAGQPHQDLTLSIHETLVSEEPKKEEKLDCLRDEYYRRMRWPC